MYGFNLRGEGAGGERRGWHQLWYLSYLYYVGSSVITWIDRFVPMGSLLSSFYCFTKVNNKAITCQDQTPQKCVYSLGAE